MGDSALSDHTFHQLTFRRLRAALAGLALAAAICMLLLSPAGAGAVPLPDDDPFYTPPSGYQSATPGTVLRSRSVTLKAPLNIPIPVRATQTLFRTTDSTGQPITAVSTLMMPGIPWLFGPRPLVSYQTPIDGLGDKCNPSYKLRNGDENSELVFIGSLLLKNYAVVVTDYEGPRNAYGAGAVAGQATLDGIRSVINLSGSGLAGTRTPIAMWGYSGGAIATGWAAQFSKSYAPELNVKAAALGGTPADMLAIGKRMDGSFMSGIFLMGVVGVSREYAEDVESFRVLLNDAGREVEQRMADVCIGEGALMYPFRRFEEFTTVADPLDDPRAVAFAERLKMGKIGPDVPVFLYHGMLDEGMPFDMAERLRRDWCDRGARVWWSPSLLTEHISEAALKAPAVLDFFEDRFRGWPAAPSNC